MVTKLNLKKWYEGKDFFSINYRIIVSEELSAAGWDMEKLFYSGQIGNNLAQDIADMGKYARDKARDKKMVLSS